jgi:hypothetical protein
VSGIGMGDVGDVGEMACFGEESIESLCDSVSFGGGLCS